MVVLTTSIRDYVPALRDGLRKVVWGLRILSGRCLSGVEAISLGIDPGSRPTCAQDIERAKTLIPEGFAMLEGACERVYACACVCG